MKKCNTPEERLAVRRWNVSIWQMLMAQGPMTIGEIFATLPATSELSILQAGQRLSRMRKKHGAVTLVDRRKWQAVPEFDHLAHLTDSHLMATVKIMVKTHEYLCKFGPCTSNALHEQVAPSTPNTRWTSLIDSMQDRGMIECIKKFGRPLWRAKKKFNMAQYVAEIRSLEKPEPGLRLEVYVPPAEAEKPAPYVGVKTPPPSHNKMTGVYKPNDPGPARQGANDHLRYKSKGF